MKVLKSPQSVLILFLSVLIVISSILIVRLEIKAASLQSQWEEHQKSLKKNEDVLYNLEVFSRLVKKNAIKIDGNTVQIIAGQSVVVLDNNSINIETKGDISIGRFNNKMIGVDIQKDNIYLKHKGASLLVGTTIIGGKKGPGILLMSPNNTQVAISDIGFGAGVPGKKGKEDDYRIAIYKDKSVLLQKGKSLIKLEKDNIDIEAIGDINIASKNGNVNINGKKVNLNE